jgi:hypothetical protein
VPQPGKPIVGQEKAPEHSRVVRYPECMQQRSSGPDAVSEPEPRDPEPLSPPDDAEPSPLDELLAGFHLEQVPELSGAAELEQVYPLLHALTRGSITAFTVRVAALEIERRVLQ